MALVIELQVGTRYWLDENKNVSAAYKGRYVNKINGSEGVEFHEVVGSCSYFPEENGDIRFAVGKIGVDFSRSWMDFDEVKFKEV